MRELIPCRPLSWRGWNPIKLAYKLVRWPAQLAASAFSHLGQYANSPGHMAYCYAELAIFFPSSSSNHRWYSFCLSTEGWPGWVGLGGLAKYPQMVTHLSTNPARCRVTSLMCPMTLPLSQTTIRHRYAHNQEQVQYNQKEQPRTLAIFSIHLPKDTKMSNMGGVSKNVFGSVCSPMTIATMTTTIE